MYNICLQVGSLLFHQRHSVRCVSCVPAVGLRECPVIGQGSWRGHVLLLLAAHRGWGHRPPRVAGISRRLLVSDR